MCWIFNICIFCGRCKRVGMDSVPETMVNLETWIEAGFSKTDWVDTSRLLDVGPLGSYGRSGEIELFCVLWCVCVHIIITFLYVISRLSPYEERMGLYRDECLSVCMACHTQRGLGWQETILSDFTSKLKFVILAMIGTVDLLRSVPFPMAFT